MNYKITNAMKTGQYDSKFGPMIKYTVQFEGVDEAVELSQKPDTPAPTAGQEVEGTIEDTQYGKKFKKAQGATGGFGGGRAADPATRASIERQTALGRAVEAVQAFNTLKGVDLSNASINDYANQVTAVAELFAGWLEGRKGVAAAADQMKAIGAVMPGAEEVKPTDEVDLSDIPF